MSNSQHSSPSPASFPSYPPMTQDENSPEVFLGPTGSETEEFYSFQRSNPGLEKAEYLEWFQKRFHKEIELRRRRSDQPSDLEFMVIKKRSKYRERIGEESAELCRHSELYPHKTYRELAEWFQDRFGKEIDITAISRALKRQREGNEASDGLPNPEQAPPAAKRGRRSLGHQSNGYPTHQPSGPVGSQPTFAVDLTGTPLSRQHTPTYTPAHTPKSGAAKLPTPEEPARPVQQQYQHQQHLLQQQLLQHQQQQQQQQHNQQLQQEQRQQEQRQQEQRQQEQRQQEQRQQEQRQQEQRQHDQRQQEQRQQEQRQQEQRQQEQRQQQHPQPHLPHLQPHHARPHAHPHPPPPQPLYHPPHPAVNGSPAVDQPSRGTLWNPSNPGLNGPNAGMGPGAAPSTGNTFDIRGEMASRRTPPQPIQPSPSPAAKHEAPTTATTARMLRSKSSTQPPQIPHHIAPAPPPIKPRVNYAPAHSHHPAPPAALPAAIPTGPHHHPSQKDIALHLHSRVNSAMEKHQRSLDELKASTTEANAFIQSVSELHVRWHDEAQNLALERDNLLANNRDLRSWGDDLQRGNLELQQFERKFHEASRRVAQLEDENRRLQSDADLVSQLKATLARQEAQLADSRKVLRENGFDESGERVSSVGAGESRTRRELDAWVLRGYADACKHEKDLKALVDNVETAGWKDLNGRLHTLKSYLADMKREREQKEGEWKRCVGHFYGSQSPIPSRGDDAGEDAGDRGDGKGTVNGTKGAPATPKPSTPAKPERTSGLTTPTSNDTIPREDEDHKMDVDA